MLVTGRGKNALAIWSATDALVLKWVALNVQGLLPQSDVCMHLRGKGSRYSLTQLRDARQHCAYRFVHRTDIRGYYAHIRKNQVVNQVNRYVLNPVLADLIHQYVHYSVEHAGEIHTPVYGIPRGCALSPLIGGSLLYHVDCHFRTLSPEEVFYARYMDDFLLLTSTRWQLRRGIARLAEYFDVSGFERHPEKTQTGRIEKGFDWLGVWFGAEGPTISERAITNHRERCVRLFEQARRMKLPESEAQRRVHAYEERWRQWAESVLRAAR